MTTELQIRTVMGLAYRAGHNVGRHAALGYLEDRPVEQEFEDWYSKGVVEVIKLMTSPAILD